LRYEQSLHLLLGRGMSDMLVARQIG